MRRKVKVRGKNGAGILSGVVAVCLLVGTTLSGVLLLVNTGCGTIYQERLMRTNGLAVKFAASHAQDADVAAETQAYVANLMPNLGIAPGNVSVKITNTEVSGSAAVKVVLASNFNLFGAGGILPAQVCLSDTTEASQDNAL